MFTNILMTSLFITLQYRFSSYKFMSKKKEQIKKNNFILYPAKLRTGFRSENLVIYYSGALSYIVTFIFLISALLLFLIFDKHFQRLKTRRTKIAKEFVLQDFPSFANDINELFVCNIRKLLR